MTSDMPNDVRDPVYERCTRWTVDGLVLSHRVSHTAFERDLYLVPRAARRMSVALVRAIDGAGWLWVRDAIVPEEAQAITTTTQETEQ